jgi:hypothetical protein
MKNAGKFEFFLKNNLTITVKRVIVSKWKDFSTQTTELKKFRKGAVKCPMPPNTAISLSPVTPGVEKQHFANRCSSRQVQ